jgi:protein PhnA
MVGADKRFVTLSRSTDSRNHFRGQTPWNLNEWPPEYFLTRLEWDGDQSMTEPKCPKCEADYTYADGIMWVCPQCAHEWSQPVEQEAPGSEVTDQQIRDAYGNVLKDGDSVIVIKELKIKGSSSAVKIGTKVKNIRLQEGDGDHNISCKIDGFGAMNLKSEFVKKA